MQSLAHLTPGRLLYMGTGQTFGFREQCSFASVTPPLGLATTGVATVHLTPAVDLPAAVEVPSGLAARALRKLFPIFLRFSSICVYSASWLRRFFARRSE